MHNDSEEKREERWKGKEKDTDTSHVGKKVERKDTGRLDGDSQVREKCREKKRGPDGQKRKGKRNWFGWLC